MLQVENKRLMKAASLKTDDDGRGYPSALRKLWNTRIPGITLTPKQSSLLREKIQRLFNEASSSNASNVCDNSAVGKVDTNSTRGKFEVNPLCWTHTLYISSMAIAFIRFSLGVNLTRFILPLFLSGIAETLNFYLPYCGNF